MSFRAFLRATLCAGMLLVPIESALATDRACFEHADVAQKLRSDGKLLEARKELAACSRNECSAVRADCSRWSIDVNQEIPTVVIHARDAAGDDVSDVRVTMDGASLTTQLDGRPIEVDPGPHTLRYERAGSSPVDSTVVVITGEKDRVLTVQLPSSPKESGTTAAPFAAAPKSASGQVHRPVPVTVWIVGGIALVALGSSAYWGIRGQSDFSNLQSSCSPRCDPSQVTPVKREVAVGDISLATGIAALGLAGVLYFTRPTRSEPSVALRIAPLPSGGMAALGGSL